VTKQRSKKAKKDGNSEVESGEKVHGKNEYREHGGRGDHRE
jgi:hypothetical protein